MDINKTKAIVFEALNEARNLDMVIVPNGGYASGYTKDKLPPYPVGLFGALSVILGDDARSKIGLTFNETMALEAAFNNRPSKLKKKKAYPELEALGKKLVNDYCYGKKKKSDRSYWSDDYSVRTVHPTPRSYDTNIEVRPATAIPEMNMTPRDTSAVMRWSDVRPNAFISIGHSTSPIPPNEQYQSVHTGRISIATQLERAGLTVDAEVERQAVREEQEIIRRERARYLSCSPPTPELLSPASQETVDAITRLAEAIEPTSSPYDRIASGQNEESYPTDIYRRLMEHMGRNFNNAPTPSSPDQLDVICGVSATSTLDRHTITREQRGIMCAPTQAPSQRQEERAAGVSEEAYREALIRQRAATTTITTSADDWLSWNQYCEAREENE